MHDGPLVRIFFRLTKNFVRYRGGVAFAKSDELQQVRNRIPFTPTKINVRQLSRFISKKEQERCNRIWYGWRFSSQNLKPIYCLASDLKDAGEFGCVARCNLEEKNRFAAWNMIIHPFFFLFGFVLRNIATIDSIRNDADRALRRFTNKLTRLIVKIYLLDSQLRRAPNAREERTRNYRNDKDQRDLNSFRLLDD